METNRSTMKVINSVCGLTNHIYLEFVNSFASIVSENNKNGGGDLFAEPTSGSKTRAFR
jgi:hypothetical protein